MLVNALRRADTASDVGRSVSVMSLRGHLTAGPQEKLDAVIVDTAGRLQIDDKLMNELSAAKKVLVWVSC